MRNVFFFIMTGVILLITEVCQATNLPSSSDNTHIITPYSTPYGEDIIGGGLHPYPSPNWIAMISIRKGLLWRRNNITCTGEFISRTLVLTAKHCLSGRVNNVSSIKVKYQGTGVNVAQTETPSVDAESFYLWEPEEHNGVNKDIAIIKLKSEYNYPGFGIVPFFHSFKSISGRPAIIMGYGLKGQSTRADAKLRWATMNQVSDRFQAVFQEGRTLTNMMGFTRRTGNEDVATRNYPPSGRMVNGDSGGPVVAERGDNYSAPNAARLIGVIQSGTDPDRNYATPLDNDVLEWISKYVGAVIKSEDYKYIDQDNKLKIEGFGSAPSFVAVYNNANDSKDNQLAICTDIQSSLSPGSQWQCEVDLTLLNAHQKNDEWYQLRAYRNDGFYDFIYFTRKGVNLSISKVSPLMRVSTDANDVTAHSNLPVIKTRGSYTVQGHGTPGDVLSVILEDGTGAKIPSGVARGPCHSAGETTTDQIVVDKYSEWRCNITSQPVTDGDDKYYKFTVKSEVRRNDNVITMATQDYIVSADFQDVSINPVDKYYQEYPPQMLDISGKGEKGSAIRVTQSSGPDYFFEKFAHVDVNTGEWHAEIPFSEYQGLTDKGTVDISAEQYLSMLMAQQHNSIPMSVAHTPVDFKTAIVSFLLPVKGQTISYMNLANNSATIVNKVEGYPYASDGGETKDNGRFSYRLYLLNKDGSRANLCDSNQYHTNNRNEVTCQNTIHLISTVHPTNKKGASLLQFDVGNGGNNSVRQADVSVFIPDFYFIHPDPQHSETANQAEYTTSGYTFNGDKGNKITVKYTTSTGSKTLCTTVPAATGDVNGMYMWSCTGSLQDTIEGEPVVFTATQTPNDASTTDTTVSTLNYEENTWISIAHPADGSGTTDALANVTGSAPGDKKISISVEPGDQLQSVYANKNGQFSAVVSLPEGTSTITATLQNESTMGGVFRHPVSVNHTAETSNSATVHVTRRDSRDDHDDGEGSDKNPPKTKSDTPLGKLTAGMAGGIAGAGGVVGSTLGGVLPDVAGCKFGYTLTDGLCTKPVIPAGSQCQQGYTLNSNTHNCEGGDASNCPSGTINITNNMCILPAVSGNLFSLDYPEDGSLLAFNPTFGAGGGVPYGDKVEVDVFNLDKTDSHGEPELAGKGVYNSAMFDGDPSLWEVNGIDALPPGTHLELFASWLHNGVQVPSENAMAVASVTTPQRLIITQPVNASLLNTGPYEIAGHATPGATVTVTGMPAGGPACNDVVVNMLGDWRCGADYPLINGKYVLSAIQRWQGSVTGKPAFTRYVIHSPQVSISQPVIGTVISTPYTINGSGNPGDTVMVTGIPDNGVCKDRVIDTSGHWDCGTSYPVFGGSSILTATQYRAEGIPDGAPASRDITTQADYRVSLTSVPQGTIATPGGTGIIKGRVVNNVNGKAVPVSLARITVMSSPPGEVSTPEEVTTDNDGNFGFEVTAMDKRDTAIPVVIPVTLIISYQGITTTTIISLTTGGKMLPHHHIGTRG